MKLSEKNKDSIEKLHLLSGENKATIQKVFQNLVVLIALNYLEEDTTNIPFIGDIKLSHVSDEKVGNRAKAVVEVDFEADDTIIRLIGNISNDGETSVEDLIKNKIRRELTDRIDQ